MHELSIANSIVEIAKEHATAVGASRVVSISLRIGALSCVHKSALEFSFEVVTAGTMLEGATLDIMEIPVTIFCPACGKEVALTGIQCFRCPLCETPSGDIRQGKELEIDSIRILDQPTVTAVTKTDRSVIGSKGNCNGVTL